MRSLAAAFVFAGACGLAAPAFAEEKTELKLNYNFGVSTDYVFRGFSQTRRNPAVQGGVDATYGIFYVGLWSSSLSFQGATDPYRGQLLNAPAELDLYAGVKPVWKTSAGDFTFDFGVIGYTYPMSTSPNASLSYLELKAGVSKELWKDGTLATTLFYSPDYQLQTGAVWTSETSFTQAFPAWGKIVPSLSALVGYQWGDSTGYKTAFSNGATNYTYWNAGATFTLDEKVSLDIRYWDTNIADSNPAFTAARFCTGSVLQCSSRTLATLKFMF